MDEFKAFLEAIRSQPDDDAPRLVMADWLDEDRQSDWAEFIRVQIRRSRMVPSDAQFAPLFARERELLAGPMTLRFGQILAGSRGNDMELDLETVDRGFPDTIDCVTSWWISHGDGLLNQLPICSVRLWARPRTLEGEDGIMIVGDAVGKHFLRQVVFREQQPNEERCELALCRLRWPRVRFEFLSNELEPEPSTGPIDGHEPLPTGGWLDSEAHSMEVANLVARRNHAQWWRAIQPTYVDEVLPFLQQPQPIVTRPPAPPSTAPPRPIQLTTTAHEPPPELLEGRVITATHGLPTEPQPPRSAEAEGSVGE